MKQKKSFARFNLLSLGIMAIIFLGGAATKLSWDQLNTAGSFTDGYVPKIVSGVVTWSADATGSTLADATYGQIDVINSGTEWEVNSTFPGTTGITTLGTITTGVWNGTALTATYLPTAAADGSTKGAASFATADFNSSSGNITIDYANGTAASSSVKGLLTSTDWTTFNNKLDPTKLTYEVVSGTVNGSNTAFTLSATPVTGTPVLIFQNGVAQLEGAGNDLTRSGAAVTYLTAPPTGSVITALFVAP